MTEWERLQNGLIYNDFDEDLFQRRVNAKKLFRAYNKTEDEEVELRNKIMQQLFKKVGKNVWIEPDFKCKFGKNITIEDDVYINFGCVILDCAEVTIGEHTLLGPNIGLYPVNHSTDVEERINGGCYGKPIHIVTKDIPSNVIAVGNPCRVIREITDEDKTDYLERMGMK